ncbi:PGPGW domain-containing protein [Edaphobacter flagellatus]|uniref:PGPGW domain-containing protein n=1 Tax=Edaphobacter flagellatus TaxID=1933044 RepID=UPI0021B3860B|nr:PGPGW domain-containing protein [Edaphobacter flagellatus]
MNAPDTDRSGWIRKASGWALLLAGIAGCILPVIPGVPLLLAGLLILARDYRWAKSMLHRVKRWGVRARRKAREKRAAATRKIRTGDVRKSVEES